MGKVAYHVCLMSYDIILMEMISMTFRMRTLMRFCVVFYKRHKS